MTQQVGIAYSRDATVFVAKLSDLNRQVVDKALGEIALKPQRLQLGNYGGGVDDVLYVAFIRLAPKHGLRVDYVIDKIMNRYMPSIAVRRFKKVFF